MTTNNLFDKEWFDFNLFPEDWISISVAKNGTAYRETKWWYQRNNMTKRQIKSSKFFMK